MLSAIILLISVAIGDDVFGSLCEARLQGFGERLTIFILKNLLGQFERRCGCYVDNVGHQVLSTGHFGLLAQNAAEAHSLGLQGVRDVV